MLKQAEWKAARDLLLERAAAVSTEEISLGECAGRILGFDLYAAEDVPPFDRSAYDGYALRAEDVREASRDHPVSLRVTETLPAGQTARFPVHAGEAAHLMTGAPIPYGADCVINFERTEFTETAVTLFQPLNPGDNIVRRGEDVRKGTLLAAGGSVIDAGLAGTLAAQGFGRVTAFRQPRIGLLSTGSEIVAPEEQQEGGRIRNANGAALTALLKREGFQVLDLGLCRDEAEEICGRIRAGMNECDALLMTGGVSVGDWDVTPEAMERCGAEMLVRGVNMKPGMACAFGAKEGKLIIGLSGNPASALTSCCVCVLPALRKLAGRRAAVPEWLGMTMGADFPRKSPSPRFLRGRLDLRGGSVLFMPSAGQGNAMLAGAIGCDAFAVIPAGSGPVAAGTGVNGFQL